MNEVPASTQARLDEMASKFDVLAERLLGYPTNQNFDYSALLPFLNYSVNNVGDPFHGSSFGTNTHDIERDVILRFASLLRLPHDEAWGYVTNGGTEGNMYGLYLGRELFPDGIVYFSEDTHYSVLKITRVLKARSIMIKSQPNGEVDYDDLYETIRINRDVPVIFMANIGTTMKGAVDDVARVRRIFDDLAITQHYIHGDAALSGMILPFTDDPQPHTFADGFDSMSISGHKLIGAPLPCGVALARKNHVTRIARSIEFLGVMDTTLSGSRNGFAPLMLWLAFERYGEEGFRDLVAGMLSVAAYAVERFNSLGMPAWRNKNSVTVVIPRPPPEVVDKWQLIPLDDIAHVITMPHVTREAIDQLAADCLRAQSVTQSA